MKNYAKNEIVTDTRLTSAAPEAIRQFSLIAEPRRTIPGVWLIAILLMLTVCSTGIAQTFDWPMKDAQISGNHDYAAYGHLGNSKYHTGPDLKSATGQLQVYATAEGTVVDIKSDCPASDSSCGSGFGNYIILHHPQDNVYSLYSHLKEGTVADLQTNQHVTQGQLLGVMGGTGHVTAPHLHFEIRDFPTLSSPTGSFGYSVDVPDGDGYYDPRLFILPPFSESTITPTVVEVVGSHNLRVRTGPGTAAATADINAYAVLTNFQPGQRFVVYREHGGGNNHWYRLDLPNAVGPVHAWAARRFEGTTYLNEVSGSQFGQVNGTGTSGLFVRTTPAGDSHVRTRNNSANLKVWDGQRLAVLGQSAVGGTTWYRISLPGSASQPEGWVSGQYFAVSESADSEPDIPDPHPGPDPAPDPTPDQDPAPHGGPTDFKPGRYVDTAGSEYLIGGPGAAADGRTTWSLTLIKQASRGAVYTRLDATWATGSVSGHPHLRNYPALHTLPDGGYAFGHASGRYRMPTRNWSGILIGARQTGDLISITFFEFESAGDDDEQGVWKVSRTFVVYPPEDK